VIRSTIPTLKDIIRNEKYSYAVKIIINTEGTYKTQLQDLKCMRLYEKSLSNIKHILIAKLMAKFTKLTVGYVS